jgi:hypothetical protein
MPIHGILLDIQYFGSVRLAARDMTYTHRCFRQSLVKGTNKVEEQIRRMMYSMNYHGLSRI